ncbi:MAG: hypothetical protein ABIS35_07170 [Terracoccus sp.]
MDATAMMTRLSETFDARDREAPSRLLHDGFTCRYVHRGGIRA